MTSLERLQLKNTLIAAGSLIISGFVFTVPISGFYKIITIVAMSVVFFGASVLSYLISSGHVIETPKSFAYPQAAIRYKSDNRLWKIMLKFWGISCIRPYNYCQLQIFFGTAILGYLTIYVGTPIMLIFTAYEVVMYGSLWLFFKFALFIISCVCFTLGFSVLMEILFSLGKFKFPKFSIRNYLKTEIMLVTLFCVTIAYIIKLSLGFTILELANILLLCLTVLGLLMGIIGLLSLTNFFSTSKALNKPKDTLCPSIYIQFSDMNEKGEFIKDSN